MSALAFWTWLAIGTLVAVPPVVFAFFLRDARGILRDIEADDGPTDGGGAA